MFYYTILEKNFVAVNKNSYSIIFTPQGMLDSTELQALGWKGLFNAERGFAHTVEIIKQMEN